MFAAELPDRRMTLKAVVVMNSRTTDQGEATRRLQDYVKGKLLPYKYPREVIFIDELPKDGGRGKIDRQALLQDVRPGTVRDAARNHTLAVIARESGRSSTPGR
ncbi:hypothetical protein BRDID11002_15270 [Bradyrhizobium diazoefficiens]